MDNVMIFVPHQDDEINLIGNSIDKIKSLGNVIIIYTSLDKRKKEAKIREREAIKSCKILGIKKENIIFLRFPDTSNKEGKHFFTQGDRSIIEDIKILIKKHMPKYIFGTDFDFHSDHRMVSLALDEAIGQVLLNTKGYYPIVFKGFCYETAYYGVEDYSAIKLNRTVSKNEILSNSSYEWKNRISIENTDKEGFIWHKKCYKALKQHKSQYAILHAKSIINRDNVFWLRRTDNLLYDAKITVSSGNSDKLKDFMILDTNDIITKNVEDIDFSKALWKPEKSDIKPIIDITFNESKAIKNIILHGNPNLKEKFNVPVYIKINDKTIKRDYIEPFARETVIEINNEKTSRIKIGFGSQIINSGISEIEIYEKDLKLESVFEKDPSNIYSSKSIIDIINNFIYDIIVFWTKFKRKLTYYHNRSL